MTWFDALFDTLIARRLRKSVEPGGGWKPKQVACWDCGLTHQLPQNVRQALASAEGFFARHEGHSVNWFEQPGVAGLWTPNADMKEAYAASAAYTITLTSLATSSTLVAGRESTAVSNTTNLYSDYLCGGRITMGAAAPTVDKTIEVWAYGSVNDTPTYPDVFDGTDSAETVTSVNVKRSALRFVDRMFVDASANRAYWFGPVTLAQVFGGRLPKNHGLFVVQDSGQALSSTAGDHVLNYTGCFQTVI
jgi:hypothetical protein